MHKAIYDKLLQTAKAADVVAYSDIGPLAGLDMENPDDRNHLGRILGEISEFEHNQGRPLLSAIVTHKNDFRPGNGFFELAQSLGLYTSGDRDAYLVAEIARVHTYWKARV